MAEPIRIGVIGCGRILPAHLRGLDALRSAGIDDFRVTALVARNPADAHRFRRRGEGPAPRPPVSLNPADSLAAPHRYVSDFQPEVDAEVYPDVAALIESGAVDAVTITASLPLHHQLALECLDAGLHVMVEKPLAVSVRAGQAMVEAADRRGLTLGVMEMVRYAPALRQARWAIERGEIGDLQMVASVSIGTDEWSPDIIVADTPWRHHKLEAGAGPALDIGVHIAHRLRYLAGEATTISALTRTFEPRRVRRTGAPASVTAETRADVDDAFFALVDFASGAAGMIAFTWAGHGAPIGLPGGMAVYGSRGCLHGPTLIRDDGSRIELADFFDREATSAERAAAMPHGITDPFGLAYLDWLNAIRAGGQPETSGLEGLRDLATAYSISESATAGAPVAVADVLSGAVSAYQREIDAHYGV